MEHGDREAFLTRIRSRQGPPPAGGPHPPPPPPEVVPAVGYRSLDGVDPADVEALLPVFVAAARAAEATVDVVDLADGEVPASLVARWVADHAVETAVTSREPEAEALGAQLAAAGVAVSPYDREAAAVADLAITSATHAVAATGSLAVDTDTAGSRAVSLLPRVHLCVVPVQRLVASHADVLRTQTRPMPTARVLITGPSRTGDIEQRLTLGAHGPVALHIVLTR